MYFLKYVATPLLRMHIVTNRFKQHITCRAIFTTVSYSVYSINFGDGVDRKGFWLDACEALEEEKPSVANAVTSKFIRSFFKTRSAS